MTQSTAHSPPRIHDVVLAQIRAVGLALRWPAIIAAVLLGVLTTVITMELFRDGRAIQFHPEQLIIPALLALLLPIAVWHREERFGSGFLWTLPVDRHRHALARVGAGWIWLMGVVAVMVLLLLAFTLFSGESILADETRRVIAVDRFPAPGTLDPQTLQTVRWSSQPLLWLTPFTAATVSYLLSSALALGTRHPWRWLVGTALGLFVVLAAGEVAGVRWLADMPNAVFRPLFIGPFGLDTVFTARTEFLKVGTTFVTGESAVVWRGQPDVGQWAVATLLWMSAGLLALWTAASRHRERRRS